MFFIWLVLLPFYLMERATDPSPGFFQSKADARNLDCARLSQAKAHQLHPDQVPEVPGRDLAGGSSDALLCASRIMRLGERPARDEAILSSLRQTVGEIAQLASALHPEEITWHVDAFYPDAAVAAKIAVAAQDRSGRTRAPRLGPGPRAGRRRHRGPGTHVAARGLPARLRPLSRTPGARGGGRLARGDDPRSARDDASCGALSPRRVEWLR